MRQTNAETAQDGHAYGDARRGQQFNTQPTNSTLRQTNAETAQDGHAYADSQWVGILPKYTLETFLLFGAAMIFSFYFFLFFTKNDSHSYCFSCCDEGK
jgi:hypothetical protein